MRDANRVAYRDFIHSEIEQTLTQRDDAIDWDVTFVRTTEAGRKITTHAQAGLARSGRDFAVRDERLVDRLIDVALAEGLGRGGEDCHLRHAGLDGAFDALEDPHQPRM